MITTRYTSLAEILERVRRDYGFEDVYYDDCKEWVWDVMGYIAAPELLIDKTEVIPIYNWRGELPVDVYSLKNHLLRDLKSSNVMHITDSIFHKEDSSKDRDSIALLQGESVNFDEGERTDGTQFISIINSDFQKDDLSYQIKGNYIFTALKEMEVELKYTAFPMDLEKMEPLIPDDAKSIRAVVTFLAERIALKLMLMDKLSERKYEMIKQDYLFNVGAAMTRARIQSVPEMENLKNKTLQILKDIHPYRRAFR